MQQVRAIVIAVIIAIPSVAMAQNPPTNYTPQSTPYSGSESWYCERVTGAVNGRCSVTDLIGSITFSGGASNTVPANPTGTSSGTGVMMGLAGAITPTKTGNIILVLTGNASNNSSGACFMSLRYGTGTAPTNGAAVTGTLLGHSVSEGTGVGNLTFPFSLTGVLTGQTLNTALWIDLALTSSGGTCTATNINIAALEQ